MQNLLFRSLFIALFLIQPEVYGEDIISKADVQTVEDVYLKTPSFSDDNILGYNVGVRPYRKSGIRLEPGSIPGKILIHNYGYGGSGLTLSWGGAQEVLSILKQEKTKNPDAGLSNNVAVLGAGVIGLATAYDLLNEGYTVTVYADKFSPNLTSNVAAGIWSPPAKVSEEQKWLISRLLEVSNKRFRASLESDSPEFAGIKMLTHYSFKKSGNPNDDPSNKFQESYGEKIVRVHFDNGVTKIGKQSRELGLDGKIFISDLYAKTAAKGANIVYKHFSDIDDVAALKEGIIINCTSLGSRELFHDEDFIPIRGQLVYLKQQDGIDYMMHENVPEEPDYWMSLYPWSDRLILGGLFEKGKEELQVDPQVIKKLIQHAQDCFKIVN